VPIGNSEVLLAAVYKPLSKPWCDEDAIHLVNLRSKSVLAGYLNAKNPAWNSHTSNPSGEKSLTLLINDDFQILAPPPLTHYTPRGSGDILDSDPPQRTSFGCHCVRRTWTQIAYQSSPTHGSGLC
jgi:hypothetical protein